MNCPSCNSYISFKHNKCDRCGEDLKIYKKIWSASNHFYNDALVKARIRDLSGAVISLKKSLQLDKRNTNARNLLGLVYYEMGETVSAFSEWVISKHFQEKNNEADYYIKAVQSNPSKLHTINQTIKKYNYALAQAKLGNLDLALIQLKKVINLNPKYIRAYQLLALLYIKTEEKEKAIRCLQKTRKIDINNTLTIYYLTEIGSVTNEGKREVIKREAEKNEGAVQKNTTRNLETPQYFAPADIDIKSDKPNLWVFFNLVIGVVIGILGVYILAVPTIKKQVVNQYNNSVISFNEEKANYEVEITTLENEKEDLKNQIETLSKKIKKYKAEETNQEVYDNFLKAVRYYISNKKTEAAELLVDMEAESFTSSEMQKLYNQIKEETFAAVSKTLYAEGNSLYNKYQYEEALSKFKMSLKYDSDNVDALYFLARCYHRTGDTQKAIKYYKKIINEHQEATGRVNEAKSQLKSLGVQV